MLDTHPKIKAVQVGDIMEEKIEPTKESVVASPIDAAAPVMQAARATDIRNPWVCQHPGCGAIIGTVFHEKIRPGLSLSRLILFRGAVKIDEMLPANFVFGKVDAGEFSCSRCGTTRVWKPSPEVLRYLGEVDRHHARKRNRNL